MDQSIELDEHRQIELCVVDQHQLAVADRAIDVDPKN